MNSEFERARAQILARELDLKKRERLSPCIKEYDSLLGKLKIEGHPKGEIEALSQITSIFRGTYTDVLGQIERSGKSGIGAINAIKRSAGTNFQGLCEYAIIQWLKTTNMPFNIGPNAPKSMKNELTIYGEDADGGSFSVEPDIDISLWLEDENPISPVIFISAKTSLVDRAGQAARWKMYLDLHQTSCMHIKSVTDCPINRTNIRIRTQHPITHSIVTANIYKIDSTQPFGELESGQCRNNTYMFKHKYTTRNDSIERRPQSWKSFSEFPELVKQVYFEYKKIQNIHLPPH
ncbi:BsaWI family type II restriction enzyme [Pseudomonas sp. JDS08PS003]|uniref:BsaWI family type II restriction enzyme n=1 Tax=Pseudomonas sp. JDS08PS003 TaxID=2497162 RepID=UPI003857AD54